MAKHPALNMSKVREKVWLKEATQEDYFDMIDKLKALYAKKVYQEAHAKKNYIPFDPNVLTSEYANRRIEVVEHEKPAW